MPAANSVTNASVATDAAIAFSKLATLSSGNVLVGNSSNVPTSVAVTGDIAISNTGVTSISSGAIVNADINASAAIAHSKLATTTAGNVLLGNNAGAITATPITGAITISSTGVASIANDAVTFSKIQNVSDYQILGRNAGTGVGDVQSISCTPFAFSLLNDGDAATARTTLGISTPAAGVVTSDGTNFSSVTVLPATNGGTGFSSYAVGDLIYANTTTSTAKLADVATGNVLLSGGVNTAPSYGKVDLDTHTTGIVPISKGGIGTDFTDYSGFLYNNNTEYNLTLIGLTNHVEGILPVANGGTGLATITGYVKGTGTSPLSTSATIPVADISGILPVANGGTGATQSAYGEYYISTSTSTTIGSINTFVKIAGTTTAGISSNFTPSSSNRLTYTGTATRKFLITAALSFHGTSSNDYKFAFYKNGSTPLSASIVSATGTGTGNLANVSCRCISEMAINEFIELFVANADATNNATVDFMNVTVVALI